QAREHTPAPHARARPAVGRARSGRRDGRWGGSDGHVMLLVLLAGVRRRGLRGSPELPAARSAHWAQPTEIESIAASTAVRSSPEIGAEPATDGSAARCWPSSLAT